MNIEDDQNFDIQPIVRGELKRLRQREQLWMEYADLLAANLQSWAGMLYTHGLTGDKEAYEKGRELREKLGVGEHPFIKPTYEKKETKMKKGDRIGAIFGDGGGYFRFLGFGIYDGDVELPEEATGYFSEQAREEGNLVPRLKLDNGDVVYGTECWFDAEDVVRAKLEDSGLAIHKVKIEEMREQYKQRLAVKMRHADDGKN